MSVYKVIVSVDGSEIHREYFEKFESAKQFIDSKLEVKKEGDSEVVLLLGDEIVAVYS